MDPHVQDFVPLVLKKPQEITNKTHISRPTSSVKVSYDTEGNEVTTIKTVSRSMAQFVSKSRIEKGMTQSDLGKKSNLDTKTISEIERGGCPYNAGHINKIAKALGVNIPRK
jgi:ribosome-binding protein aMBF1 (putative translation factor)